LLAIAGSSRLTQRPSLIRDFHYQPPTTNHQPPATSHHVVAFLPLVRRATLRLTTSIQMQTYIY